MYIITYESIQYCLGVYTHRGPFHLSILRTFIKGLFFKRLRALGTQCEKDGLHAFKEGSGEEGKLHFFSNHNSELPTADTAIPLEGIESQRNACMSECLADRGSLEASKPKDSA